MENLKSTEIDELVSITPVQVLSQNIKKIADALSSAAQADNQVQVKELAASGESLLQAITKLS